MPIAFPHRRLRRTLTFGSALGWAVALAWVPVAQAQTQQSKEPGVETMPSAASSSHDVAAAERYAAQAFDAYGRKDYQRAALLYEKALKAAPGADILYNLARIHDLGLRNSARAIEYYRAYLKHPSSARPRSEYAELRILELQSAATARLNAQTSSPSLDSITAEVTSRADSNMTAEMTVVRKPEQLGREWTGRDIAAVATAGAGLASLIVSARFGIMAYAERDTWRNGCNRNSCDSQLAVNAARNASDRADVATIALATGGGLLAIASALLWIPSATDDATPDGTNPVRLQLSLGQPGVGFESSGFWGSVSGNF